MFNAYQPNLDNLQQYMKQENERSNYSSDGPNWWSIPSGMSSVRILPPWDPTGRVALPVYMHPIEFQGKGMKYKKWNWTCVNKTFSKPCAICEGLASMSEAGVDVSKWEANRRQFYFNVIVMHDPTYNQAKNEGTAPGTHAIMKAGKTVYDWVISQITNPMIGDITNVENGIDVYITKEGQGLGTEYKMTLSPNGRTPIPKEYLEKITDLYNLDDIFSTGFEKEQTDELVDHLRRSSGAMGSSVSNMSQQMAGYPSQVQPQQTVGSVPQTTPPWNTQTTGYPPMNNPVTQTTPIPPMQTNVAPTQTVAPATQQTAPTQATTPSNDANMPKCFGQYDPGNVNCVVCPQELNCAQIKNG